MDSPIFSRRLFRALLVLALLLAVGLALDPEPPHLPIDTLGDKFEHSLAFGVLTVIALLGYPDAPPMRIVERLSFLGALIEVFQSIPALHRDSDVLDWITDTVAIILVLLIARAIRRRADHSRPVRYG
jgi:VanZ family protein